MGQAPVQILDPDVPTPLQDKRLRWAELGIVLAVAFSQPLIHSIYMLHAGSTPKYGVGEWNYAWISGLLNEIMGLLVLAYVLKRSRRTFKDLGFSTEFKDIGIGLLLFLAAAVGSTVGSAVIRGTYHFWYGSSAPIVNARTVFGDGVSQLMVVYILLAPFFEELIVRAYLITEVHALTNSVVLATVLSVALQTSCHLYYGYVGALTVACVFAVFAIYYARTRRATPVIIAHGLLDIMATAGLFAASR